MSMRARARFTSAGLWVTAVNSTGGASASLRTPFSPLRGKSRWVRLPPGVRIRVRVRVRVRVRPRFWHAARRGLIPLSATMLGSAKAFRRTSH